MCDVRQHWQELGHNVFLPTIWQTVRLQHGEFLMGRGEPGQSLLHLGVLHQGFTEHIFFF